MRWTERPSIVGKTRTRRPFAWLPIKIDRVWMWLERYEVDEVGARVDDAWGQVREAWILKDVRIINRSNT